MTLRSDLGEPVLCIRPLSSVLSFRRGEAAENTRDFLSELYT